MKRLLVIAVLGLAVQGYAQQTGTTQSNVDPAVAAKVKTYVSEVFKNCPEYAGDAYLPPYIRAFNRLEIQTLPKSTPENYPLLSEVKLIPAKCNPDLKRDENFSPGTFNPFKYRLDYTSTSNKVYRVDNTDYIIVIKPAESKD